MADSDNESGGHINTNNEQSPREHDRFLPIANVSRIMKKALAANAKISKDAKETVQECVSEFISFITGEASDKCQREKRKTVNGDDLLWAMTTLGFEDYVEPLKIYLQRFRDMEEEKTAMAGHQDKEGSSASGSGVGGNGSAVSMGNSATIFADGGGDMTPNLMMMMGHPTTHQRHVYGAGAYHQMTAGTPPGNPGMGYHGSGSSTTRQM